MATPTPKQQLTAFMARYAPEVAAAARRALATVRQLVPGAVEMVYDNYNALVVGFGPTERPSEAVLSVILYPRWVTLCFLQGAKLSDPTRRLKGSGKQVRTIRLDDGTLDEPAVRALIAQAVERAPVPFDPSRRGRLIIKSVSAAQRPRRPAQRATKSR